MKAVMIDWKEYVGETFQGPDNKVFQVESFDPKYGFRLSEIGKAHNKVVVSTDEIIERYQFIFEPQVEPKRRSIRETKDGHSLLDRAFMNLYLGMSVKEIITIFQDEGYSQYDIYLTIKGAQLLIRK